MYVSLSLSLLLLLSLKSGNISSDEDLKIKNKNIFIKFILKRDFWCHSAFCCSVSVPNPSD